MEGKLTLSIDKKIIERAKIYAKKERRSISDIVENYLKLLTSDIRKNERSEVGEEHARYSPIAKLKGAFQLGDDRDYKEILSEELWKKYMK